MGWRQLQQSDEVAVADWIRDALHPFAAHDVGSVIPAGFDAYARIFHPAWLRAGLEGEVEEVRWSEVAAATGREVHAEMQFHAIAVPGPGYEGTKPIWDFEPKLGVLSRRQMSALVPLLGSHTSTPERCLLCLWDGYGYLHAGSLMYLWAVKKGHPRPARPPVERPPAPDLKPSRVRLPARDYLLFTGSTAQAAGWEDGPNLWWPEDRAWCVASEIDFPYTYVGGSTDLIEAVVADRLLESTPAALTDGTTYESDKVNS